MLDDLVIGAGIAGLTIGFRRRQQRKSVKVLEASPRAGGLISTLHQDGLTLEQGPQSLQAKPAVLDLIADLDLVDEILVADEDAKYRYLLGPDGLRPLPTGLSSLFSGEPLRKREALRIFAEPFVRKRQNPQESVHDFLGRRFGPAVANTLANPFIAGVFGGDPKKLDASAAFADLTKMEARHGSIIRGMMRRSRQNRSTRPKWAPPRMFTFKGGVQALTDRLASRLEEELELNTPAQRAQWTGDHWVVSTPGETYHARNLWMCCSLVTAQHLLPTMDLTIPTAPLAAIHLAYDREAVNDALQGFGWLAHEDLRRDALGALWVSSIFPRFAPGRALIRVMVGGTRMPELVDRSDEFLVSHARKVLKETQGIDLTPSFTQVASYTRGIPQYPPGYGVRVAQLQDALPNLTFCGWGTTGIGVSHCVQQGELLATLRGH